MKRILVIMMCAMFIISIASAQETKKKQKETVTFFIENMECENCIKKIEKNIAFEKGVTDLKCDLPSRTVEVTYRTDKTDIKKLTVAFDKIGKKAKALKEGEKPEIKHDGHKH